MLLRIRTSDGYLDLQPGADKDFYITKQLHDLHDLETREADFTKTISLPYSPNNIRLLGINTPKLNRHSSQGTQFIPVTVEMSGIPVLNDALMRINVGNDLTFSATLFAGVAGFFTQLTETPINELDWSDLDFEWTGSNLLAKMDDATGICYPFCNWYTNDSIETFRALGDSNASAYNKMDIAYSGFFVYVREILDRVFASMVGITVDYGDLENDDTFNRLAIACPMDLVRRSYTEPPLDAYNGRAETNEYNVPTAPGTNLLTATRLNRGNL